MEAMKIKSILLKVKSCMIFETIYEKYI